MKLIIETDIDRIRCTAVEGRTTASPTEWLYPPYERSAAGLPAQLGVEAEAVDCFIFWGEREESDYAASVLSRVFPRALAVFFSNHDFFSALPDQARVYAIPERYGRDSLGRRGGYGFAHQWAWSRLAKEAPGLGRALSVYVGGATNVVALRDGKPIETSMGFSPAEGLPSLTAAGDMDPTMLFELHSSGFSLAEIDELVTSRSGIRGYLGADVGFTEFLARKDARAMELREIFTYQLVKYLGGSLAVLGGADAIVFLGDGCAGVMSFIGELCAAFSFAGIDAAPIELEAGRDWTEFSRPASSVRMFFGVYDKIGMLSDLAGDAGLL